MEAAKTPLIVILLVAVPWIAIGSLLIAIKEKLRKPKPIQRHDPYHRNNWRFDELESMIRDLEIPNPPNPLKIIQCPNCGAPFRGNVCDYCGTQLIGGER